MEALGALRRALVNRTVEALGTSAGDPPMRVALTSEQFVSRRPSPTERGALVPLSSCGFAINWFWRSGPGAGVAKGEGTDGFVEVTLSGHGIKQGSARRRADGAAAASAKRERKRARKREKKEARKRQKMNRSHGKGGSTEAAAAAAAKEMRRKAYKEKEKEKDKYKQEKLDVDARDAPKHFFLPALPKVRSRLCRAALARDVMALQSALDAQGGEKSKGQGVLVAGGGGGGGRGCSTGTITSSNSLEAMTYRELKERCTAYKAQKDALMASRPFIGWLRTDRREFMSFEI